MGGGDHKASQIKSHSNEHYSDLFSFSSSSTESVTLTQLLHPNCMSSNILSKGSAGLKGSQAETNIWPSYSSSC